MTGYIKRACRSCKSLEILAIRSRRIGKETIYIIYIQDVVSGRSWFVLRLLSELLFFRRQIRNSLNRILDIQNYQLYSTWKRQLKMIPFPSKASRLLRNQHVVNLNIHHYLTAILQHGKTILLIKPFLASFFGHPTRSDVFRYADAIPQQRLSPEKRVHVSKCGTLDTVHEDS